MTVRNEKWYSKLAQLFRDGKLALAVNYSLIVHYNPEEEGFTRVVCSCTYQGCNCYFIAVAHIDRLYEESKVMVIPPSSYQYKITGFVTQP